MMLNLLFGIKMIRFYLIVISLPIHDQSPEDQFPQRAERKDQHRLVESNEILEMLHENQFQVDACPVVLFCSRFVVFLSLFNNLKSDTRLNCFQIMVSILNEIVIFSHPIDSVVWNLFKWSMDRFL